MKLFISQPMRGKSDEEILAERERAIQRVKEQFPRADIEVIDSFFQDDDSAPLALLGKALQLLSAADVAFFAKGWADARGCKIEHICAIEYGVPVIEDSCE